MLSLNNIGTEKMTRKKTKRGHIHTLDKNTLVCKQIASMIRLKDLFILLDAKGRQISYANLTGEEGKTVADADACTVEVIKTDSFINLSKGNYVRWAHVEAVEICDGQKRKGILIRGEGDAILSFLPISQSEIREKVADALHDALVSFEAGKFAQPDLNKILSIN